MSYPITSLRHKNKVKGKVVFTPEYLSQELFDLAAPTIERLMLEKIEQTGKPAIVLDTCVGMGALLKPFKDRFGQYVVTVGVDTVDYQDRAHCDIFIQKNWLEVTRNDIDFSQVVFAVQFPPFSDFQGLNDYSGHWIKGPALTADKRNSFIPDLFLTRLEDLKPGVPSLLITPMGFRLNQRGVSRRRRKYSDSSTQIITGIVSLPMDIFQDTMFHCETLFFNVPGMPAHTWGGSGEKNPKII